MRLHIHVITLAVTDLERALEFYRRLTGVTGCRFENERSRVIARLASLDGRREGTNLMCI